MAIKANFITPEQATAMIADDSTVCCVGMTLISAAESILKSMEKVFLETGSPKNLTYVHSAGQCDRVRGNQHLCHEGMVKRVIGSHWGLAPKWMELISSDKVEAYCLPQGQITHLYTAMAEGKPGIISKIGLATFIDPRQEGGKMNSRTKLLPDISEIMTIGGKEYMFYHEIPLDVVIIRGTYCDEMGNLCTDEEAMKLEVLPAVLAAKRYNGKVIAQVKKVVANGTIHPKKVVVPGVFIDAIVVCDDPAQDHRQTSSWYFDPAFCGDVRVPMSTIDSLPLNVRKIIGRRAIMEIYPRCVINLGTGIPNDVVGAIAAEEGVGDEIVITVESGIYGGVQAGGIDFGIGKNLFAMIEHDKQMDYYNGAGVDITFMGAGEMDKEGNVNSTKMGPRCTGAGGFMDITQNAKHVVFCSTFSAKGLEVDFEDHKVNIRNEGSVKKLVNNVAQISYNGKTAREKGQKMTFVTERCVFELGTEGPVLTQIAPGVDLEKDILANMEFVPIISKDLKLIPECIYNDGVFNLLEYMQNKQIGK
jgi:propionate CoA-transferase